MKTRLFILFLMSLVLCACDANRRAQRRIRRITEQCPELLSVQAHPIDTDNTRMRMKSRVFMAYRFSIICFSSAFSSVSWAT